MSGSKISGQDHERTLLADHLGGQHDPIHRHLGDAMTHDPLCPTVAAYPSSSPCAVCELIARVRADEQDKAEQVIKRHCGHTKYEGCQPCWHDLMARDLYEEA